jgi:molybdopterin-guanine dinucleotide biosynthesis protein MobB
VVGWSGSGKTTLVTALLPALRRRGLRVSTIKHAHHGLDLDRPGKDSFAHREAGAEEVLVVGGQRWALLRETPEGPPGLPALAARMAPVDLILVEGFKGYDFPATGRRRPRAVAHYRGCRSTPRTKSPPGSPLTAWARTRSLERRGAAGHGAAPYRPGAKSLMRRVILLATTFLLTGCAGSGFYSFLGNTFTVPGANPNIPRGNAENYIKVRANPRVVELPPPTVLNEAGDIWPGPPTPPRTLRDLQKQQNQALTGEATAPLQPLPELPGYDVPNQPVHVNPPPSSLPSGIVHLPNGTGVITGGTAGVGSLNGPTGNGSIVVPNGNGTSTVIGPNGTVSTIPTPGK